MNDNIDAFISGFTDKRSQIQSIIINCIQTLHSSENLDNAINELLAIISKFYEADRGYIFEFDDDLIMMHNTYEWCREGIEPAIDMLSNVEISTIDRWLAYFEENDEFYINARSEEVPENSEEHRLLVLQNIDSLMVAPLKINNEIIGFIGVDNPSQNTDQLFVLKFVSAFISNDIYKKPTIEQQIIQTLAKSYKYMNLINIPRNTRYELKNLKDLRRLSNRADDAQERINKVINDFADSEHIEDLLRFHDLETLTERMGEENIISLDLPTYKDHWIRASFIVTKRDPDNSIVQVIHTVQDIDIEKQKELEYQHKLKTALENQNEIYAEMLHMQGSGMIASYTGTGKIITVNDAALELFGLERVDNLYTQLFDNLIADNKDEIRENFLQVMQDVGEFQCEYAIKRTDGQIVYVLSEVRSAVLASGERVMINSFMDITDKKKLEQELYVLSETDALTHICNRRSGEKRIENLLSEGQKGMYCLLDIDKFKSINDKFGHAIGDAALIETANCLKRCFRSTDVTMRLGGDEFAAFLIGIESEEQGAENINRFFKEIEKISIPEMGDHKITVSLGAVFCNSEEEKYEKLYAKADSAMYVCKNKAGNYFGFYKE